jgi:hypothetical protein
VSSRVQVTPRASTLTCPFCRDLLGAGLDQTRCPACDTRYHGECFAELASCGTVGCEERAASSRTPADTARARLNAPSERTVWSTPMAELSPLDVVRDPLLGISLGATLVVALVLYALRALELDAEPLVAFLCLLLSLSAIPGFVAVVALPITTLHTVRRAILRVLEGFSP